MSSKTETSDLEGVADLTAFLSGRGTSTAAEAITRGHLETNDPVVRDPNGAVVAVDGRPRTRFHPAG